MIAKLNPRVQNAVEESFSNDKEAHELLALIAAEFQSDPMSVQCFDLRIVERVKLCVEKHKKLARDLPWVDL